MFTSLEEDESFQVCYQHVWVKRLFRTQWYASALIYQNQAIVLSLHYFGWMRFENRLSKLRKVCRRVIHNELSYFNNEWVINGASMKTEPKSRLCSCRSCSFAPNTTLSLTSTNLRERRRYVSRSDTSHIWMGPVWYLLVLEKKYPHNSTELCWHHLSSKAHRSAKLKPTKINLLMCLLDRINSLK
jgi:hypothetical protein